MAAVSRSTTTSAAVLLEGAVKASLQSTLGGVGSTVYSIVCSQHLVVLASLQSTLGGVGYIVQSQEISLTTQHLVVLVKLQLGTEGFFLGASTD